jgi:hypothetical protein
MHEKAVVEDLMRTIESRARAEARPAEHPLHPHPALERRATRRRDPRRRPRTPRNLLAGGHAEGGGRPIPSDCRGLRLTSAAIAAIGGGRPAPAVDRRERRPGGSSAELG